MEWVSGAFSPFPEDTYQGGYTWQSQLRLYVYSTGQSGVIGAPSWYTSFELAEAAAKGTYILIIPSNTVVAFYFYEGYDMENCTNNRGSATLKIDPALATTQPPGARSRRCIANPRPAVFPITPGGGRHRFGCPVHLD